MSCDLSPLTQQQLHCTGQCSQCQLLRPSASPCARWCRHRPIAAPTRFGFSLRCCIAPHTPRLYAVSPIAARGSCLSGNRTHPSGSQLKGFRQQISGRQI
uniref:Uncharacterized protein n=1 Tax=Arundo donax TaxID=35708 RepID=A0A0A9D910_ARUDO